MDRNKAYGVIRDMQEVAGTIEDCFDFGADLFRNLNKEIEEDVTNLDELTSEYQRHIRYAKKYLQKIMDKVGYLIVEDYLAADKDSRSDLLNTAAKALETELDKSDTRRIRSALIEDLNGSLTSCDSLRISKRTINALKLHWNHIVTVSDLLKYTREELLEIPGFGKRAIREIENALDKHFLKLKEN